MGLIGRPATFLFLDRAVQLRLILLDDDLPFDFQRRCQLAIFLREIRRGNKKFLNGFV
jgi:hypothetical protein